MAERAVSDPIPMPVVAPPPAAAAYPWWVLPGLAALGMIIFAGALAASCFLDDTTLRTQMFTAAVTLSGPGVYYFFGSSSGSAKKDDALAASSVAKDATIAAQGSALAVSAPVAPVTTTTKTETDAGATTTVTAPAEPAKPAPLLNVPPIT